MSQPVEPLLEDSADPDPLVQFGRWYDDAARVLASPEAMAVASADAEGRPSARIVLLKDWGERGFVFHTNYDSRKGHELTENPYAALLFHWAPTGPQVRVEAPADPTANKSPAHRDPPGPQVRLRGPVERTSDQESDDYFTTRPRGGQIAAYASHQSQTIASRALLGARV